MDRKFDFTLEKKDILASEQKHIQLPVDSMMYIPVEYIITCRGKAVLSSVEK